MTTPDFDPPLMTCNLCKSPNIYFKLKDCRNIRIYECDRCSVEFMNPQYTDQYLDDLYREYLTGDEVHHRYQHHQDIRIQIHHQNLADLEQYTSPGAFLSVGCGRGYDLTAARRRGWQPEGYEVEPSFVKALSAQLQLPIRSGIFEELEYPINHYDCVYLNHVLEHPKDPASCLTKCYEILKPGGTFYLACPNIAALSIRVKKIIEYLGLKKSKGRYYDTWQHLFYYTPSTLTYLLEKYYGFKVVMVGNDRKYKLKQSSPERKSVEFLAYRFPYKASFRLIAIKR